MISFQHWLSIYTTADHCFFYQLNKGVEQHQTYHY